MIPPVYTLLAGDSSAAPYLGTPARVYPWGEAPQGVAYPYVTWGVVIGLPENYLGQRPDVDSMRVQVDVWARSGDDCLAVAEAARDALEADAHLVGFGSMERDPETKSFRYSLEFEFWTDR